MINKVLSEKVEIYDPLYLVDFKARKLSIKELNEYCDCSLDSIKNEKFRIIFLEDWYFDQDNLKIKKEVKGIGLVRRKPYKILFYIPNDK